MRINLEICFITDRQYRAMPKSSKFYKKHKLLLARNTCLIPDFGSSIFSVEWREARWARFSSGAPPSLPSGLTRGTEAIRRAIQNSLRALSKRHGISRLPEIEGDKPGKKKFKSYPIGYFHIDIAEVQTVESKLYLFVAIDRTSKFAFVQLVTSANRVTTSASLVALIAAVPYKILTILTDNGIQFRYPLRYADGPTARHITHMFAMRCEENGIEHRLTKLNHPWTNGQVERMIPKGLREARHDQGRHKWSITCCRRQNDLWL